MSTPNKRNLLLVSGLAGSGKSVVLNALADLGYTCVDNLPAMLLTRFVDLVDHGYMEGDQFAIALDARDPAAPAEVESLFKNRPPQTRFEVLFLEATEVALISRFRETRRAHPLMEAAAARGELAASSLSEAIRRDIAVVAPIKALATRIVDSTSLSTPALKQLIRSAYGRDAYSPSLLLNLVSFGFKHGAPQGVDMMLDVRCFQNPHYVPELKPKTGLDEAVRDYVLADANVEPFIVKVVELLSLLRPLYATEGKRYFSVGIGCTGGQHRSVAIAEELGRRLAESWGHVRVEHRDAATA